MHADRCEATGVPVVSGMLPIIIRYSHPNAFYLYYTVDCTFNHHFDIVEHSFLILFQIKTCSINSSVFTVDMKLFI